jgi:hypothetical protein
MEKSSPEWKCAERVSYNRWKHKKSRQSALALFFLEKEVDYFAVLLLNRTLRSIDYDERWPNEESKLKGWIKTGCDYRGRTRFRCGYRKGTLLGIPSEGKVGG